MFLEADEDAIISLDAFRIKRNQGSCDHKRAVVDQRAGTVECRECGAFLSAFAVLVKVAHAESEAWRRLRGLQIEAQELLAWRPFLKAMKSLERVWRGKRMLPCCPHCHRGLWPTELDGSAVGIRYEIEARKRDCVALPRGIDASEGFVIVENDDPISGPAPETHRT
jgi:hypothetical protein